MALVWFPALFDSQIGAGKRKTPAVARVFRNMVEARGIEPLSDTHITVRYYILSVVF